MFLDLLRGQLGEKLLRVKGIVWTVEDGERPLVIHGVQRLLHTPERLEAWPSEERGTRLVLIVKDISESYVRGLFDAFLGKPRIDTPDRAALVDNPLAIPGAGRL
jgi:G3E family GTPase